MSVPTYLFQKCAGHVFLDVIVLMHRPPVLNSTSLEQYQAWLSQKPAIKMLLPVLGDRQLHASFFVLCILRPLACCVQDIYCVPLSLHRRMNARNILLCLGVTIQIVVLHFFIAKSVAGMT